MLLLDVSRLVWRRWAGRLPTGIDRVCLAYFTAFGERSLAVVQRRGWRIVLDADASKALFALLERPGNDFRLRFVRQLLSWARHRARRSDVEGKLYLNLGHTGLDEDSLGPWVKEHDLRAIYFVHDLIPLTHPEYCRSGEDKRHARRMRTVLTSGAGVIGNSQQTIDDLADWARDQDLPTIPALPALLGSELDDGPALPPARSPEAANARPTFVVLGTIEGRKNHLMLLQVWARLAALHGTAIPMLKIVGQRGWESEQATDMLDRAVALRGHVEELGRCSDVELARLLSGARALLFPSFAEGYGLPLAEALRQGTPVIASDLPVFREIGGDIPLYLDPLDGPAWIAAIMDYARPDSAGRREQLARLKEYRAPSWDDHFAAVDTWLDQFEQRPRA